MNSRVASRRDSGENPWKGCRAGEGAALLAFLDRMRSNEPDSWPPLADQRAGGPHCPLALVVVRGLPAELSCGQRHEVPHQAALTNLGLLRSGSAPAAPPAPRRSPP